MEDLFNPAGMPSPPQNTQPLAARLRPRNLEEFVGQRHILGPGKLLRRAIEADRITSVILYGPPGTGKTTLAHIIAHSTACHFERLSGVESGAADIRRVAAAALARLKTSGQRTLLFVDEIHRFNKSQQDLLLPDLEKGTLRFVGATTHNPFFYINSPLISRSQVFELQPLDTDDLVVLLQRAVQDRERGFSETVILEPEAAQFLAEMSDGDARRALHALEIAVLTTPPDTAGFIRISLPVAEQSIQKKAVVYDGDGDAHYDTASAFIKSLRGCDPDAAIYWLAKMLHAGEDIRFITRRMMIFASEDVGLADSQALALTVAAHQACEIVGLPEARLILAHTALYLATAPKSASATRAIAAATADVEKGRTLTVPSHLRDSHYPGARKLRHGQGYQYPQDYDGAYVPQAYLPEGRRYYHPTSHGLEQRLRERLDHWRRLFEEAKERGKV